MNSTLDRILAEQKSKAKLSLLIFVSLLIASLLLLPAGQVFGWVFLGMALIIGASLLFRLKRNKQELDKMGDRPQAAKELAGRDTVSYEPFGLTVSRRFAISEKPALEVFVFDDLEKFEVGLAGDARKVLFLTDRNGKRHPVAETRKDDGHQEDFDRAYEHIRRIFAERIEKSNS